MCTKSVEAILTRATSDRAFARLLWNDPNKVAAFYQLNGREIVALKVIFYIGFGRWLEALREIDRREMSQLVAVEAEIPAS